MHLWHFFFFFLIICCWLIVQPIFAATRTRHLLLVLCVILRNYFWIISKRSSSKDVVVENRHFGCRKNEFRDDHWLEAPREDRVHANMPAEALPEGGRGEDGVEQKQVSKIALIVYKQNLTIIPHTHPERP